MGCPKIAYSQYSNPAMRCVYNAAGGQESYAGTYSYNVPLEEWNNYNQNYRNQGLYRNHDDGVDLVERINHYGTRAGEYGSIITPSGNYSTSFVPKWWHWIYKIPRKW